MKKKKRFALLLALLVVVQIVFSGSSSPDFIKQISDTVETMYGRLLPGNAAKYHLSNVQPKQNSPLKGKRLLFLGSSVTYGAGALGESMADDIRVLDSCEVVKEAVSGTTLADTDNTSYYSRLKANVNPDHHFDAAVVQLSTNDASKGAETGAISGSKDPAGFNVKTTFGSLESIISYIQGTWRCPVLIYTNPKFSNSTYEKMVSMMPEIQKKWGVEILDLWNDPEVNSISPSRKLLYMRDPIHPTQAGYLELWTPKFEQKLYEMVK